MSHAVAQVAPGVHRLGSSLVNCYLVEEAGRYTLVDAGLPAHFSQLHALMARLGADIHDIDAVVLTHAHADAIGMGERVRTEAQARVHLHGADAQRARSSGGTRTEHSLRPYLWRPTTLRYLWHLWRGGAGRVSRIEDLTTFVEGATLPVPGRLQVIGTPGHSHGHCSLLLPERSVLFAGDALCSRNPLTGRHGPQLMPHPLNADTEQALASLERLEDVEADTLLFGHGEPWTGGVREAVARARTLEPG